MATALPGQWTNQNRIKALDGAALLDVRHMLSV